jgi:hypothetical protein
VASWGIRGWLWRWCRLEDDDGVMQGWEGVVAGGGRCEWRPQWWREGGCGNRDREGVVGGVMHVDGVFWYTKYVHYTLVWIWLWN